MNTHDKIELPPLPAGYTLEFASAMRNYARAAVEVDRKRRGESVNVPEGYALIAEDYLEVMIGPERMDHLRQSCRFPTTKRTLNTQLTGSVSKTDWSSELSSWSDEEFIRIFHERPDLADRLRKILTKPVKRKHPYAQGTALGEFGIIPMCDQVDAEPVKCVACEGRPAPENNPCAVCGKEAEPGESAE